MKKSFFILFAVITVFFLTSCGPLFEAVSNPEKKYLCTTGLKPDEALNYIGELSGGFDSTENHYAVTDCLGFDELNVYSIIAEYSSFKPFFSTYLQGVDTNATMRFSYVSPSYDSSKQYVEFLMYTKADTFTDIDGSNIVAYETIVFTGDFTNPPASGDYAKSIILTPDMRMDMQTETLLETGAAIPYSGTPADGKLTELVPDLTTATPAGTGGGCWHAVVNNGEPTLRRLSSGSYPPELDDLGDLIRVCAYCDEAGNVVDVPINNHVRQTTYYAVYSDLFQGLWDYYSDDSIDYDPDYILDPAVIDSLWDSYIEYIIWDNIEDPDQQQIFIIWSDNERLYNGITPYGKFAYAYPPMGQTVYSVFGLISDPLNGTCVISDYPYTLEYFGDLIAVRSDFDNDIQRTYNLDDDEATGTTWLAEYSSLSQEITDYFASLSYTERCDHYSDRSEFDSTHFYIEYWECENWHTSDLDIFEIRLFDTTGFIENSSGNYAKVFRKRLNELGGYNNPWDYIYDNQH